jgi:fructan beta-fructosidase
MVRRFAEMPFAKGSHSLHWKEKARQEPPFLTRFTSSYFKIPKENGNLPRFLIKTDFFLMNKTTLARLGYVWTLVILAACSSRQDTPSHSTAIKTASDYTEAHRPQFHFSPDSMWMNDPNGMVYFEGEYHLFYQYYPDSTVWGPMHWGHAVSTDMVHWEHLPIALYPNEKLGLIFSGSAVVDKQNTTGFGSTENPPLVAIFTYHSMEGEKAGRDDFQTQGIAYSLDKGRTWTEYEGNPVIPNPGLRDFRDPKVFWHAASSSWVMIFARGNQVRIYRSPDLKQWEMASEFGEDHGSHDGVWECPDLFELPVGTTGASKWMMIVSLNAGSPNGGSGTQYFVGEFDGATFTNDNPKETVLWLDYGRDDYAGVTWSDIPASDGRRLFLGWMSNWSYATVVPTERWRSAMTIARELQFAETPAGIRAISLPVTEMNALRSHSHPLDSQPLNGSLPLPAPTPLLELELEFALADGVQQPLGIRLANDLGQQVEIGFDPAKNQFFTDRRQSGKTDFKIDFAGLHTAPNPGSAQSIRMHIYLDVASLELFAQDGHVVMTDIFFPDKPLDQVSLFSGGEGVQLVSGSLHELQSIWRKSE